MRMIEQQLFATELSLIKRPKNYLARMAIYQKRAGFLEGIRISFP